MGDVHDLRKLKFKGDRTYVHGTDLFDAISEFFESIGGGFIKDLKFRSFSDRQCRINLNSLNSDSGRVVCQGAWQGEESGDPLRFLVVESEYAVTDRYSFDEDALCEGSDIEDAFIQRRFNSEFSMIENVVALTKYYHNIMMPLSHGKWVFGQITLDQNLPSESDSIQIQNYQNIQDRFSRNRIFIHGQRFGEIRFIVS